MNKRIFIAINLPVEVKNTIGDLIVKLKKFRWPVKWEAPEKLHITLRFLGDISDTDIQTIQLILHKAVTHVKQFEITINGFVAFPTFKLPNFKFPKVLGLKVIDSPDLFKLQSLIAVAVDKQGIGQPEAHPFSGHITLGRMRSMRASYRALTKMPFLGKFEANSLELVESTLGREGSTYSIVESFQLLN